MTTKNVELLFETLCVPDIFASNFSLLFQNEANYRGYHEKRSGNWSSALVFHENICNKNFDFIDGALVVWLQFIVKCVSF